MQNVAIFGGTFNPVHWGHLLMAELAVSQFKLDCAFWVPTYRPPHKSQFLVEFGHRLAMVQQAIADNPSFVASDIEAHRSGPSYAIETFQSLKALHSECRWHWIMGQDAFQSLPRWRGIDELAADCTWLVAPRSSEDSAVDLAILPDRGERLHYRLLEMPTVAISSSLIRRYCQQGRSLRYLVPEPVRQHIQQYGLFRDQISP